MNKVRIVSAIASATGITLYLENGQTLNLANDSWKTQAILDEALPALTKNKAVTIDLDTFSVEKAFEQKTGGVIRFFKRIVGKLVGGSRDQQLEASVAPIVSGQPEQEELVAVVKTKNGDREIPGAQKLQRHIEHAVATGNAKGLQKFMERLTGIQTNHTVQELLTFMERGDLPIADDGMIVAYKILQSSAGVFVDCHSKKVRQKLGSRVMMAKKLVDASRRTQCSSGLHVARRGYLRHFPGDVITLIKIDPADVVAVPVGEPDKMRVAAYHIVAVLPTRVHDILRSNRPMTGDTEASKILADVIAGNHVGVLDYVRIGEDAGEKITHREAKNPLPAPAKPQTSGEAKAVDDAIKITPKDVRAKAKAAKAEPVKKAEPKKRAAPPAAPAKTDDRGAAIARALALVSEGKLSMRAIERETGVPARTIGRVLNNK